ncbi:uncharacterized protein ATC70_012711 [Mucor velutinosus]|uniref:Uncharacterized protein n=1 Tax=Mucor velutinosus TaxID=708070 RepID=A0AAN7DBG6_9FUNG|nr:hypothetical protein ATC70_012711 [Mucor velutinosus]
MIFVRQENENDYDRVGEIIAAAFRQQDETKLVNKLRENKSAWITELSLVATRNEADVAIGYILFTTSRIGDHSSLVLAPLAVDPMHQASGVVNVLGHKDYYTAFGFEPAWKYNITSPFDLTDPDVLQIKALSKNGLEGVSGKIVYARGFVE